jgi:hypothetical protein
MIKKLNKVNPVTGRGGLCEILGIQHCLDNLLTDGDDVGLTHRSRSTPQKFYFSVSGINFC